MTKRELGAFVLKLLGVYAIIQSLPLLGFISSVLVVPRYQSDNLFSRWMFIGISTPFILTAIAGIVLLRYSRSLAFFIVKEDDNVELSTTLSSEDIQAIGFSVAAVLVFLLAIPQLSQFITSLWYAATEGRESIFVRLALQAGLSAVVQFGLAIILFFRARGLANLWHRIQVGKYVKVENAKQNVPDGPQEKR